jgi:hypothetical protein
MTEKKYLGRYHAGRHEVGGGDEIDLANLGGVLTEAQTPTTHKTSHQNAGADEIDVGSLSGELADLQPVKDHTHQSAGSGVGGKLSYGCLDYEYVCNNDEVVCNNDAMVYI